jgi:hypothetical protein
LFVVVPSTLILVTLMMEALRSSDTLVLTRATRRHIAQDAILFQRRSQINFHNCTELNRVKIVTHDCFCVVCAEPRGCNATSTLERWMIAGLVIS